ncbi:Phosphatidylinositol transfer protein (PITP) [Marasmius tenuissimus]|uniref:Phosphatidylinositol transfer protein (PITP) n=1 Tax=Marasmius tenuissimus TaxID=585030 RepID=A0ABR2ZUY7_9AGAR
MSTPVCEPTLPPKDFIISPKAPLTPKQEELREAVQVHFTQDGYLLPGVEKKQGELMEEEKFWLSYECQIRYLRATSWKVPQAIRRLESTLKWRREFGLYTHLTAARVEPEGATGKEVLFGYDVNGRPACYMTPSRQNTEDGPGQVEYFVWMAERSMDLMDANVETIDALVNCGDGAKLPSLATARAILSIQQDHYPERLGNALIINTPFYVTVFFKLITPFLDAVTAQKMKFNPDLKKEGLFQPNMVMKEWGGEQDFEYKHEVYWPKLAEICDQRRKTWMENWRKLGGRVGIREVDYKSDKPSQSQHVDEKNVVSEVQQASSIVAAA